MQYLRKLRKLYYSSKDTQQTTENFSVIFSFGTNPKMDKKHRIQNRLKKNQ